jgi:hypothetical protein
LRGVTRCKRLAAGRADDELLLGRQALHAQRLKVAHPASGAPLEFEAPLPADMAGVLELLREAAASR